MNETLIVVVLFWLAISSFLTWVRLGDDRHLFWQIPVSLLIQPIFMGIAFFWYPPYGWFGWREKRRLKKRSRAYTRQLRDV